MYGSLMSAIGLMGLKEKPGSYGKLGIGSVLTVSSNKRSNRGGSVSSTLLGSCWIQLQEPDVLLQRSWEQEW
jgi:hypothetical protein